MGFGPSEVVKVGKFGLSPLEGSRGFKTAAAAVVSWNENKVIKST